MTISSGGRPRGRGFVSTNVDVVAPSCTSTDVDAMVAGENSAPAREAGPPMTWLYRRSPMSWHHGAMPEQLPVLDQATAAVCCAPLASAPLSVDDARGLA